jgi:hypothetical protein
MGQESKRCLPHLEMEMTKLTVDETTAALFTNIQGEVVICDATGHVLGWYAPASHPTLQELIDSCPTSEKELLRRLQEERHTARTWPEIKRDLEAM